MLFLGSMNEKKSNITSCKNDFSMNCGNDMYNYTENKSNKKKLYSLTFFEGYIAKHATLSA